MSNLYELLGIKRNANLNTIRKAFRRKALIVHPDRNKSPDATENFREIANAYEVLSDPQQRTNYDKTLFVSTTPKTQETKKETSTSTPKKKAAKQETKKPRDPSPPKKEEPKKYKKYSPSENSFKYPSEEKWSIDKIEKIKISKSNEMLVLLLVLSPVIFSPFLSCITEGSIKKARYCLCVNVVTLGTDKGSSQERYWAKYEAKKSCSHLRSSD